jgi:hypothetical protein
VSAWQVHQVREWFRNYKVRDGKPPNQFGLGEKAMGADFAKKVAKSARRFNAVAVASLALSFWSAADLC